MGYEYCVLQSHNYEVFLNKTDMTVSSIMKILRKKYNTRTSSNIILTFLVLGWLGLFNERLVRTSLLTPDQHIQHHLSIYCSGYGAIFGTLLPSSESKKKKEVHVQRETLLSSGYDEKCLLVVVPYRYYKTKVFGFLCKAT